MLVEGTYDGVSEAVVFAKNVQNGNLCEDWVNIEAPKHFHGRKVRLVLEIAAGPGAPLEDEE